MHERRVVQAQGMVVVLHQARHQRGAELRMAAAGVVERESRDVELALDHGVPLIGRLEKPSAGIDLDIQARACRERTGVVSEKRESVSVSLVGSRIKNKKNKKTQ